MLQLSDNRCPITANCPITLSDFKFTERLVKNEAAPIGIEEFVMVMINPFLTTYFFIFASNMLHFFKCLACPFKTLSVAMLKITYPVFCCLKRKPFQCQLQINELLLPYEHIFHLHPLFKVFILSSSLSRKKCTLKSAMQTLLTITALIHCLVSILAQKCGL